MNTGWALSVCRPAITYAHCHGTTQQTLLEIICRSMTFQCMMRSLEKVKMTSILYRKTKYLVQPKRYLNLRSVKMAKQANLNENQLNIIIQYWWISARRHNSIANALEWCLFCTNPLMQYITKFLIYIKNAWYMLVVSRLQSALSCTKILAKHEFF